MDAVRDAGTGIGGARERLLAIGGRACSTEELLALVLAAGGLARLERLDGAAEPVAGRGACRWVVRVRAALELGRRAAGEVRALGEPIRDAAAVHAHVRDRLPQLDREVFLALLLDGRSRLQAEVRVSEGTLTTALVHPREVFAPAIRLGAAAIILVHNHPSGDPTPSAEDAALTERLRQVGELVGIRVIDHVVVGHGRYVSLAETRRW